MQALVSNSCSTELVKNKFFKQNFNRGSVLTNHFSIAEPTESQINNNSIPALPDSPSWFLKPCKGVISPLLRVSSVEHRGTTYDTDTSIRGPCDVEMSPGDVEITCHWWKRGITGVNGKHARNKHHKSSKVKENLRPPKTPRTSESCSFSTFGGLKNPRSIPKKISKNMPH